MIDLATLTAKIVADTSGFAEKVADAQQTLDRAGEKMVGVGRVMTAGVTLPIVGIGTAAVLAGNRFNEGMANVASLGEEASKRISEWSPAIQQVAIDVGKGTGDMTQGLYQVVSAYGATDESVQQLALNAKLGAAGLSSTSEAIALTSAVTKGYGDTSTAAQAQVADLAMKTVQMGQVTFPELAASIGRVTPLAAALGVTQEELFGVMATGTGVTGTASEVSTQLRGVLQSMMAPTQTMSDLISSMGYESGEAMIKGEGLQGAINTVMQAVEKSGTPLQSYIGSIEGQTLAMTLAGPQAQTFTDKLASMATASGTMQAAFEAQTEGVNANGFAMDQAQVKVGVMMEKLSNGLAPAITLVIEKVSPLIDKVVDLAGRFADMDPKLQTIILAVMGVVAAIGPLLMIIGTLLPALTALGAVIGVVGTVLGVVLSPIGLVVIGIGLLIAAVILLVKHWDEVKAAAERVWEAVRAAVVEKVQAAKQKIDDFIQGVKEFFENFDLGAAARAMFDKVVTGIGEKVSEAGKKAVGWLDEAFVAIENFDLKAAATTAFETVVVGTGEKVSDALGKVGTWLDDTWDNINDYDLKAAATTAFNTVVVGTGEKVSEALGKVGTWLGDSYDKIRDFDLKGAATTAFNTVVLGQAEKTSDALIEVGRWLTHTADKIREHQFKSETMTAFATAVAGQMDKTGTALKEVGIWLFNTEEKIKRTSFQDAALTAFHTVVNAIVDKAKDILGKVQKFLEDSRQKIENFSLFEVGKNLIQGMIDGIGSMGSALAGAMRSLIQSAIDRVKALFGIKSPSEYTRVEIGIPLAEGIAQGILDAAPPTGTALQSSISGTLAELSAKIQEIVAEFRKLAELYATDSSLASAKAVADPLGDLFQKLSDVAEGVNAVSGLALADIQQAEANAGPFVAAIKAIVGYMETVAAQFTTEGWVESVKAFSEGAEAAVKPVKDGMEALLAISEGVGKLDGNWIDSQMAAFTGILGGLVQYMKRIGAYFTEEGWVESVKAFSEGAVAATAPVENGVKALIAINDGVGKLDGNWIDDRMDAFVDILGGLVEYMRRAGNYFNQEGWVEKVKDFSAGAIAATAPVENGIKALVAINEGVKKLNGSTIDADMGAFTRILGGLVEYMRQVAVQFTTTGLDSVKAFSAAAGTVATQLVDAAEAIVDKGLPASQAFANASATIGDNIIAGMEFVTRPVGFAPGIVGAMQMIQDTVVSTNYNIQAAWGSLAASAYLFGQNWIGQLINGINSRLADLDAVLRSVNGRFNMAMSQGYQAAGAGVGAQGGGSGGNTYNVNVYNPAAQAAEDSLLRQMRNLAVVGAI